MLGMNKSLKRDRRTLECKCKCECECEQLVSLFVQFIKYLEADLIYHKLYPALPMCEYLKQALTPVAVATFRHTLTNWIFLIIVITEFNVVASCLLLSCML